MARDRRTSTAFHEAGHASMAWAVGFVVDSVSIRPVEGRLGRVTFLPPQPGAANTMRSVLVGAGGLAADNVHWTKDPSASPWETDEGSGGDREKMLYQLHTIHIGALIAVDLALAYSSRVLASQAMWPHVERVAQALLADDTLSPRLMTSFANDFPKIDEDEIKSLYDKMKLIVGLGIRTHEDLDRYLANPTNL